MQLKDAEKLMEMLEGVPFPDDLTVEAVRLAVWLAPEIDAVPVVRCKDCKCGRPYKYTKEYVACEVDCEPIDRDKDFFCAYGKRRDNVEIH